MTTATATATATATPGAAWDAAADGWNDNTPVIRAWLHDSTEAMLDAARIGPGAHVFDIAAGAGDQTLDIARRVGADGHVLATDLSPRILALAERNARAAGLPQIETRIADAQRLGLDGAGFDAAVCRLGLMFCTTPLDALRSARAALRPGGRFVALVFGAPQANPCVALMMQTAFRHRGLPAPSPFTPGTLLSLGEPGRMQQLMDAAGFVDIDVQALPAPFDLPSASAYIDFVRTSGSPLIQILAPLGAEAQRAAWDDMTAQLQRFAAADGWHGPNELLLCAGSSPRQEI